MNTELIILIAACLGLILFCIAGIATSLPWLIQDYPKEWEEQENKEIIEKFDEHKKSQE